MSDDKQRVFIADKLSEDALKVFEEFPAIEVVYRPGLSVEEKKSAIRTARALIVRSATRVDAELLDAARSLELVVRAGVGVDNVDVPHATRRGIAVQNVPDGNTRSAAEHTIALILALARNVAQGDASLKSGEWDRSRFVGTEVQGKRLGIVGLGKIGRHVAAMATGLGFQIYAFDPFLAPRMAEELGVTLVSDVGELASQVDFLTVHVPKTDGTKALLGAEVFARAKPGLRVINCARGGIVDEAALLKALDSGQVGGAALDVFSAEPPEDFTLIRHPKVVSTPHLGASTKEAQENVAVAGARLVVDYLLHGKLHFPVNAATLEPELRATVEPYGELARRLGQLHAQLLEGNPSRIVVKFYGEIFEPQIRNYVTSAVLVGFLGDRCEQPVNWINARELAKEQGIAVEESDEGPSRYFANMMRIEVVSASGRRELGGTMRGHRGMRLVALDSFIFDAILEGTLLISTNEDRPGMIGVLGTALGAQGVNIANMSLGRHPDGGKAISLLNLEQLDDSRRVALEREIASKDGILWARVVTVGD